MTGSNGVGPDAPRPGASGPDLELLAELDAGLLDADRAAEVRAAAARDPAASEVLQALAATRAELAAEPVSPIPRWASDRWAAALESAAAEPAAVGPPEPAPMAPTTQAAATTEPTAADEAACRPRHSAPPPAPTAVDPPAVDPPALDPTALDPTALDPTAREITPRLPPPPGTGALGRERKSRPARRPRRWSPEHRPRAAVLAAALLAAIVGGSLLWPAPDVPRLPRTELVAAGRSAVGDGDLGALADPARRAACLRAIAAAGIAPDSEVLGGRQVELDGHRGILLVFPAGELGVFRVVVVDPECGPAGGTLLDTAIIGR